MTGLEIGIISLAGILFLVALGLWIPFALMLCSFLGVWFIKGSPELAGKLMALAATDAIASDVFTLIPMFILVGFLAAAAGLGRDAIDVANSVFGRLPGGLGVGTVGANAMFASITGVSVASAVVFTRIALSPMVSFGYRRQFVLGLIAGSSVLGMLIPPSLLLILYGILTDQSVGALFVAGIVPGLLLAVALGLTVVAMARWRPAAVMVANARESRPPPLSSFVLMAKLVPLMILGGAVLGGIYSGLFTTREAAAVGCLVAFVLLILRGKADRETIGKALSETATISASICFLIVAAQMYARMLSLSGLPAGIAEAMAFHDLGFAAFIAVYVALLIVMGTSLDSASVMIVLVPLALPVALGLNLDPVWLGIVTIIAVEIGLLTPPFGMSVFAIKAALDDPDVSLSEIFLGAAPFVLVMLLVLGAVIAVPELTGLLSI